MNQPKVSIIIPVYNAEAYIERCVKTLFGQTLNDLEYIFIDDCSPDRSIAVMEEVLSRYPERQAQVKIIRHAENKGVSQSRQDGLDAATGEYLIHCDPDDWVEFDMYESLYNEAVKTNADMVICDFRCSKNKYKSIQRPKELTNISVLECITSREKPVIHGACWNKLLRTNIAQKVQFPKDVSYCEDVTYWCNILRYDIKISYLGRSLYIYDYRPGTLCSVKSKGALISDNRHIELIESMKTGNDLRYDACLNSYITTIICYRAFLSGLFSNREFVDYYAKYKPYFQYCIKNRVRFCLTLSANGFAYQALIIYKVLTVIYGLIIQIFAKKQN